ncbi:hypothetical protein AC249_AIPGENE27481 [Exaiptasia diaphana]|nr:hypothetical protein AC249_AIPGENE27481 [Exaiptasia diaphana]
MEDNSAENISKFTKNNLKLFNSAWFMDASVQNEEDKPPFQQYFLAVKLRPIDEIKKLPWISCDQISQGEFIPVKSRSKAKTTRSTDPHPDPVLVEENDHTDETTETSSLFACTEDGYVKSYITYNRLQQHLTYVKHEYKLEKRCLIDKAKIGYAERLEAGAEGSVTLPHSTSTDIFALHILHARSYLNSSVELTISGSILDSSSF